VGYAARGVATIIAPGMAAATPVLSCPFATSVAPLMIDPESIRRRIAELQLEHRGLDAMIEAIGQQTRFDEIQLRRLKKRKLQIKDAITLLQMQLVPDQPA
jgi:hypothetical protein